jgi:hypothetical protein
MVEATSRLTDFSPQIGKVTIAAAYLEEIVLINVMALSDDPPRQTRYTYMHKGIDNTLTRLRELVTARVSNYYRQGIIDLIEEARNLKNKRNENVHAVWAEMCDAGTRDFVLLARQRYEKDKSTTTVTWDITIPTIEELAKLIDDLRDVAERLRTALEKAWKLDESVRTCREAKRI